MLDGDTNYALKGYGNRRSIDLLLTLLFAQTDRKNPEFENAWRLLTSLGQSVPEPRLVLREVTVSETGWVTPVSHPLPVIGAMRAWDAACNIVIEYDRRDGSDQITQEEVGFALKPEDNEEITGVLFRYPGAGRGVLIESVRLDDLAAATGLPVDPGPDEATIAVAA